MTLWDVPGSSFVSHTTALEPASSLRSPCSFYWRMIFRNQNVGAWGQCWFSLWSVPENKNGRDSNPVFFACLPFPPLEVSVVVILHLRKESGHGKLRFAQNPGTIKWQGSFELASPAPPLLPQSYEPTFPSGPSGHTPPPPSLSVTCHFVPPSAKKPSLGT